jgi:hypothetical protein
VAGTLARLVEKVFELQRNDVERGNNTVAVDWRERREQPVAKPAGRSTIGRGGCTALGQTNNLL